MKSEDEKMAVKCIIDLKERLEKYIDLLGEKKIEAILIEKFALSKRSSKSFIQVIEDMIPGVHHDAIPLDWYFQRKRLSKSLKNHSPDIRKEYQEIKHTVQAFRILPYNFQEELIEIWPERYRDKLLNKFISAANRSVHEYKSSEIAKEILADRYCTKFETINTYLKNV